MTNPTALITGASSGIGEAYARQLAARGMDLLLTGRRIDRLENLAEELRARHKVRVEALAVDLSTEEGIQRAVAWTQAHAPIRLLVNNAGYGIIAHFVEGGTDAVVEMIHTHNIAPVRLMGAVLPAMRQANEGAIINVASPSAFAPVAGNGAYAGTKAFLAVFSESLAKEVSGTHVKVQILLPGFTYSDFHKRPPFARVDMYHSVPGFMWMRADDVVRASLRTLDRGGLYCIPSPLYRVLVFLGRLGLSRYVNNSARQKMWRAPSNEPTR